MMNRKYRSYDELPLTLECELLSYDGQSCHLTGRIVNVCADESILTEGRIDPSKLRPISFDPVNNAYLELGEKVADAFSCGMEPEQAMNRQYQNNPIIL